MIDESVVLRMVLMNSMSVRSRLLWWLCFVGVWVNGVDIFLLYGGV